MLVPQVCFSEFRNKVTAGFDREFTEIDYRVAVGKTARLYRDAYFADRAERTKNQQWKAWLSEAKAGFDVGWDSVEDLEARRIDDLADGTGATHRAYAIHYRMHMHAHEVELRFSDEIDKRVFGAPYRDIAQSVFGPSTVTDTAPAERTPNLPKSEYISQAGKSEDKSSHHEPGASPRASVDYSLETNQPPLLEGDGYLEIVNATTRSPQWSISCASASNFMSAVLRESFNVKAWSNRATIVVGFFIVIMITATTIGIWQRNLNLDQTIIGNNIERENLKKLDQITESQKSQNEAIKNLNKELGIRSGLQNQVNEIVVLLGYKTNLSLEEKIKITKNVITNYLNNLKNRTIPKNSPNSFARNTARKQAGDGKLDLAQTTLRKAIDFLKDRERLQTEKNSRLIAELYKEKASIYELQVNYKSAYDAYIDAAKLLDFDPESAFTYRLYAAGALQHDGDVYADNESLRTAAQIYKQLLSDGASLKIEISLLVNIQFKFGLTQLALARFGGDNALITSAENLLTTAAESCDEGSTKNCSLYFLGLGDALKARGTRSTVTPAGHKAH